jgi:hypothetical protein
MAVVPGDVLLDHGLCRGVSGHVVDASLVHYKDLAPISECFAIFGANSHDKPTGYEGWRRTATISDAKRPVRPGYSGESRRIEVTSADDGTFFCDSASWIDALAQRCWHSARCVVATDTHWGLPR